MPVLPAWMRRRKRAAGPTAAMEGAMIMAVDYQRRGSNFEIGQRRYAVDRAVLVIDGAEFAYPELRALRINKSYLGGLVGWFSLPGAILVAFGVLPASKRTCVLRADIVTDRRHHVVSSMTARGFGRFAENQIEVLRWFVACLAHRLPPSCRVTVGSSTNWGSGMLLLLLAVSLLGLGVWLLSEQSWWGGGSLTVSAITCALVGWRMVRDGATRTVDVQAMLAYVGSD